MTSASNFRPIDRNQTLGTRIYTQLCDLLISGRLVPGETLSLRKLAEQLEVSIMPVREAVARLVADDILAVMPNRAVCVPIMTEDKLRELTEVRIAIEGFAAEKAAQVRSSRDLERIVEWNEKFRLEESNEVNISLALYYNKEFHFAIYNSVMLPTLVSLIRILWLKVGPVINLDLSSGHRLRSGVAQGHHQRLVSAIASGNGADARAAITDDITDAAAFILSNNKLPR